MVRRVSEDPTRYMDPEPPRRPAGDPSDPGDPGDGGGMSRGTKVLIAVLAALVVGLGVALAVIASDDDGDDTTLV